MSSLRGGSGTPTPEEVWEQFIRISKSGTLTGHSVEILKYLLNRHYDDGKEVIAKHIATDVLKKKDFTPRNDNTAAKAVGRLRKDLTLYYLKEGSLDPILIEIPVGAYAVQVYRARPTSTIGADEESGQPREDLNPPVAMVSVESSDQAAPPATGPEHQEPNAPHPEYRTGGQPRRPLIWRVAILVIMLGLGILLFKTVTKSGHQNPSHNAQSLKADPNTNDLGFVNLTNWVDPNAFTSSVGRGVYGVQVQVYVFNQELPFSKVVLKITGVHINERPAGDVSQMFDPGAVGGPQVATMHITASDSVVVTCLTMPRGGSGKHLNSLLSEVDWWRRVGSAGHPKFKKIDVTHIRDDDRSLRYYRGGLRTRRRLAL